MTSKFIFLRAFLDIHFNSALQHMQLLLEQNNSSISQFAEMPVPTADISFPSVANVIQDELNYDLAEQTLYVQANELRLNQEQKQAYEIICTALNSENASGSQSCFFIDGLGGTGKTFLYSLLLNTVRAKGEVALAVASCALPALIMQGGRTAHSRFKFPLVPNETSTCNIPFHI
jgi:primosomal protein N'